MEHEQRNKEQDAKMSLIFDVDDVILDSTKAIAEILSNKFQLNPILNSIDNKSWDFTSFKREIKRQKDIEISTQEILELFALEEFWNTVEIKRDVIDILLSPIISKNYKIIFASKGTEENLRLKKTFLERSFNMNEIEFIGMLLNPERPNYSKEELDISNGIQIDDNYKSLRTNAKLKILLKNDKDTDYNQVLDPCEDVYIVNNLEELKDMLVFIADKSNEFFKKIK